jgi:hypothetical protein
MEISRLPKLGWLGCCVPLLIQGGLASVLIAERYILFSFFFIAWLVGLAITLKGKS